jgi:hypothetical protein
MAMNELLQSLNSMEIADLEVNLPRGEIPLYVSSFYEQLKTLIDELKPQEYDPVQMQKAIFNAFPDTFLYQESMLAKLSIMSQMLDSSPDHDTRYLGEFYVRIQDKILSCRIAQGIEECMHKIIQAFKQQNLQSAISACQEFGALLNEFYPNKNIEKLQKELKGHGTFEGVSDIPFIELYRPISEGTIRVGEEISNRLDSTVTTQDIIFMDELSKGLNCFAGLINEEFVNAELQKEQEKFTSSNEKFEQVREDEIEKTTVLIRELLLFTEEKKVSKFVEQLLIDCNTCLSDLEKDIKNELKKSSLLSSSLIKNKDKTINIERLIKDINVDPSSKLGKACYSYQAVAQLREILVEKDKAAVKIGKFQELFNNQKIQDTLKNNKESSTISFLKTVGYILLNIATLGIVHRVTHGMFLFPPAQQLTVKASKTLAIAKKEIPRRFNNP